MTVTEATRLQLYEGLKEVLGVDRAETLMAHLPPSGWAGVATRADLDHLASQLRSEMTVQASGLRTEMAELQSSLRTEMAEFRTDLHREFGAFRLEVQAERRDMHRQMLFVMAGAFASILAVIATAL